MADYNSLLGSITVDRVLNLLRGRINIERSGTMANNFLLTLDTLGPQSPSIVIESGAAAVAQQLVDLAISTSDSSTTGYSMKIWGDVDTTNDAEVQDTAGASTWITYNATKQIKLSETDGTKTIYLLIKDDVGNVSSQVNDAVTLDMTVPVVVLMTGPTPAKISKIAGFNSSEFAWQCDSAFIEYKVKVVASAGDAHSTGTLVLTTGGSSNMTATGTFDPESNITSTIKGSDLEIASAGDGNKVIKIFVKDIAGNWSA